MQSLANILIMVKKIIIDPKFKVGDHVRISKYKKYFCRLHPKLVWRSYCNFYEKELQKTNQRV